MTFIEVSRIWIAQFDGLTLPVQPCKSWNWLDPSLFTFPMLQQLSHRCDHNAISYILELPHKVRKRLSYSVIWEFLLQSTRMFWIVLIGSWDQFFVLKGFGWNGGLLMSVRGNTDPRGCRHMPGCLSPVRVEEGGAWNTGDGAFLTWSRRFFFGPILEGFQWIWQLRWEHAYCFPGRAVEFKKFKMKPEIHPKGER